MPLGQAGLMAAWAGLSKGSLPLGIQRSSAHWGDRSAKTVAQVRTPWGCEVNEGEVPGASCGLAALGSSSC